MQGLHQGTVVQFVQQLEDQGGTNEYAAIVSQVYEECHPEYLPEGSMYDWHNDGDVNLHAFMENRVVVRHGVPYSGDKLPNTWHFIEG